MAFFVCLLLCGCGAARGSAPAAEEPEQADTGFYVMEPDEYDSKDTAVVVGVSEENSTITFLNHIVNKNYTLEYDGSTEITDKYGQAMSVAQLSPGQIVDVNFQHGPKRCVSVSLCQDAWEQEVSSGFTMNQLRGQISFNGELYTLAERMVLRSEGEEINLMDLNEQDVLQVQGIDNTVYSIIVKKGHGYLRLTGAEYFVDGFIEIGQKIVQRITEDMLLTVPEGQYTVVVRNGVHGGSKEAAIYRDEETVLDVSDLKGEEVKIGNVFFTLTPVEASVYIDGEKVDTSTYVPLEYGVHQMIVKADGYETISQYLKVGQENANLDVEMEPEGDGETPDGSQAEDNEGTPDDAGESGDGGQGLDNPDAPQTPGDGTTPAADGGSQIPGSPGTAGQGSPSGGEIPQGQVSVGDGQWHVKVNAPVDAEVYVDGSYVGLAPTSFPKKAGSHVISLRKNGYQTRSYTIQVDEEEKDMELSFSELVKKVEPGINTTGLGDGSWTDDILSQTLFR